MGTYAITLTNYTERYNESLLYKGLAHNINDTNQKYKPKEIVLNDYSNSKGISLSSDSFWDSYDNRYIYFYIEAGGSAYILTKNDDNEWVDYKTLSNPAHASFSANYFIRTESGKVYGLSSGLGEYDKDFNYTPNGYDFAVGTTMAYDTKRNYLLVAGVNPFGGFPSATKFITQLDLNKEASTIVGITDLLFPIILNQYTTTNEVISFLTYSSSDDMYYYVVGNNIYKTNPTTGVAEIVKTKGTDVIGFIIEEGTNTAYYAYIENNVTNNVIVSKFNLDDPNGEGSYIDYTVGNVYKFQFIYVGKVTVFLSKLAITSTHESVTVLSSDLITNLSREKYMATPISVTSGLFNLTFPTPTQYFYSTVGGKQVVTQNPTQKFKPLSGDEVDIHIPVSINSPLGGISMGTTSFVLNINPVVAYPVVSTPTVEDCCLDELKCDINTKLAKKSCEATKRAIVGRHYGGMTNDSELLEALLWITTFDCLTCDEIEKLRCITSKI